VAHSAIWVPQDIVVLSCGGHRLHLHHLLRQKSTNAPYRVNIVWTALGCLRDNGGCHGLAYTESDTDMVQAPAYASEICPMALRHYLTSYVCLCWAFGQLISAGVLNGFQSNDTQWAFRIPFAIQWIWPIPLAIVLFFVPESPYWLARRNRLEEAESVLERLASKKHPTDVKKQLAMIVHTNKVEDEISTGSSYIDCFKGVNLRRTMIVMVVFVAQNTTGVVSLSTIGVYQLAPISKFRLSPGSTYCSPPFLPLS
jgi:hypothetical protein